MAAATNDTPDQGAPEGEKLPFTAHLEELRSRLIKAAIGIVGGFAICYTISEQLFGFLVRPLEAALPEGSHLAIIRVQEGFLTHLKISLLAAIFLASPVILFQAWRFVAPGLYPHEKRYVWPFVGSATLFFLAGGSFAYWAVFPFGFKFLLGYAGESIDAYLGFAARLLLAFGLVFELPVVVFFLARMGLVTHRALGRGRAYALVVIVIVAAILTPPDVFTQLLMAGPLYALYEISILVARVFGTKPEADEGEEPGHGAGQSVSS